MRTSFGLATIRDGRHVVTVTRWRRSDKRRGTGADVTGQAREAPTERREGLTAPTLPQNDVSERDLTLIVAAACRVVQQC